MTLLSCAYDVSYNTVTKLFDVMTEFCVQLLMCVGHNCDRLVVFCVFLKMSVFQTCLNVVDKLYSNNPAQTLGVIPDPHKAQ